MQVAFASMFALIALIVLLSAIWFGLNFANRLVAPIRRLIHATDQVATGNFYVQVPVRRGRGRPRPSRRDLQQDDLGAAPPARRPDRRERPHRPPPPLHRSRAVGRLGGRDRHRCGRASITIVNPSAEALLGVRREQRLVGQPIADACCRSSAPLVDEAMQAAPAAGAGADPDHPQRQGAHPQRPGHERAGPRRRARISSSRSTTSPTSSRRSAPPPGRTSPAASPTRSRTR